MSKVIANHDLIHIGWDKNGEMDFGVNGMVSQLTYEQVKELREMIVVAIWAAEDMWHREQEKSQRANQVSNVTE